eukprot:4861265-Prymnesium_polylepis.2
MRRKHSERCGRRHCERRTVLCHLTKHAMCTHFWPPMQLQGAINVPSSSPEKQKRHRRSSSSSSSSDATMRGVAAAADLVKSSAALAAAGLAIVAVGECPTRLSKRTRTGPLAPLYWSSAHCTTMMADTRRPRDR